MGIVNYVSLRANMENEFVIEDNRNKIHAGNGMSMFPPKPEKPFDNIERVKTR